MRDRRELMEETISAFNRRDWDAVAAAYTENAELSISGFPSVKGRAAIIELWKGQFAAFPDGKLTVKAVTGDKDLSVGEFKFEGTNTGPLAMPNGASIAATGKSFTSHGASVAELEGDLIKSQRLYSDNVELMSQLGLMPAPAQS